MGDESIANFFEEGEFGFGRRGIFFGSLLVGFVFFGLFLLEMIDETDKEEDGESDDEKVDNVLNEVAVGDAGVVVATENVGDGKDERGEVGTTEKNADKRHENVGDERRDDFAESATNDDTDGEIYDATAIDKGFEFLKKRL